MIAFACCCLLDFVCACFCLRLLAYACFCLLLLAFVCLLACGCFCLLLFLLGFACFCLLLLALACFCLLLLGFACALPSHTHTHTHACCCIRSPGVLENAPDPAYTARIGIEQGCATLATPNVPTKLYSSSNSQIGATSCSALFRWAPSALEYAGSPEWCDDNLSVVVASLEPLLARRDCVE